MNAIFAIVGRNLRLYFRDRMGVFFSLLAALILFLLYTLFLGDLQSSALEASFPALDDGVVEDVCSTPGRSPVSSRSLLSRRDWGR